MCYISYPGCQKSDWAFNYRRRNRDATWIKNPAVEKAWLSVPVELGLCQVWQKFCLSPIVLWNGKRKGSWELFLYHLQRLQILWIFLKITFTCSLFSITSNSSRSTEQNIWNKKDWTPFSLTKSAPKASVDRPQTSLVPKPTCSLFQALPPPHLSLSVYISWKKVGLLGCLSAFQNPRISFSFDSFLCVISPFLSYLYLNSICVKIVFADYSLHSVPFPNIPWNFMSTTSHFLETRLQFFFEARDIPSMWMLKMLKK